MSAETPVTVTPEAAKFINDLIKASGEKPETDTLRIFVQGGGCSGLQHGIAFDTTTNEGDISYESNGIKLVVDPISASYLKGSEIRLLTHPEGMAEPGLIIYNPNNTSTCSGCKCHDD